MILYGWHPDDLKPIHKLSRHGHYTSDKLVKIWGQGTVDIAQAVPQTYNYVAGYVTKKLYGNDKKRYQKMGLIPPFCTMSRKPGLGDQWFQNIKSDSGNRDTYSLPTAREQPYQNTTGENWKRRTLKKRGESNSIGKKKPLRP